MKSSNAEDVDRRDDGASGGSGEHDAPKDDLGFALPEPAQISRARIAIVTVLLGAALGGAFLARYLPNRAARAALESDAKQGPEKAPRVEIVAPAVASSDRSIELPGAVSALEETVVYARATGYLKKWLVDIGDKVATGDELAEIETPELDQQIAQARAQAAQADAALVQAKATAKFSKLNAARYETLHAQGLASQEDLEKNRSQADVDAANVLVAAANANAQRANIDRLVQLKSFTKVAAPFGGTITARMVERGQLVTEGTSPLFRVTATDPARVFVQVPQELASGVQTGMKATVRVREFGGRAFDGTVARSAGALDAQTRTMTTEVRVANPKGELLAGMYALVSLTLPTPHRIFVVPATALLNDASGLRVATVTKDDRIHLVQVRIERDTGSTIEIASGLDGTERVVKVPTVQLVEGTAVEVAR